MPDSGFDRQKLLQSYQSVRKTTEEICKPLEVEDYVIQSMDDVSPAKWHLGHTTWFYETFLLGTFSKGYTPFHPLYAYIYNSYYETIGARVARPTRGMLSRPTVQQVYQYRSAIDGRMLELIQSVREKDWDEFQFLLTLGLNHEQQHQELLITDLKHVLSQNPLKPVYREHPESQTTTGVPALRFVDFEGGILEIGYGGKGFSFDNERPRHRVFLDRFGMANRLITNREYIEFMNDGGYSNFKFWLSEGWFFVNQYHWNAPLYWEQVQGEWHSMTLSGFRRVNLDEPVCHISYFEADAFARWAGKRLPLESEWEVAADLAGDRSGNFMESKLFHPAANGKNGDGLLQMFGDVWEWTASAYLPYPGFKQEAGAISEYNGKFMSNQMILRGGSCATPGDHIRPTYRNFFQPDKRWQFSGIRLADS